MQSDDLDNEIRGLAESNEPAFDEKGWDKMELLLDKHLPQEKKRRRIYFFLLFILLVSIPGYLVLRNKFHSGNNKVQQPGSAENITKSPDKTSADKKDPVTNTPANKTIDPVINSEKSTDGLVKNSQGMTINKTEYQPGKNGSNDLKADPGQQKILIKNNDILLSQKKQGLVKKGRQNIASKHSSDPVAKEISDSHSDRAQKSKSQDNPDAGATENPAAKDPLVTNTGNHPVKPAPLLMISPSTDTAVVKNDIPIPAKSDDSITSKEPVLNEPVAKKISSKKGNKFAINFSLGPDISSVGIHRPGKTDLQYGLGLGYSFTPKLMVRAGFYTSRKRYVAAPDDYHPPAGYWTYTANMEKIEADCNVYEIPVNFLYNFSTKKEHSWFASAGVSSYIMKKELYGYYYKNSTGQSTYYARTIDNKNKHLFSVLNLSGGYSYIINKHLSFMAEPYIKIPLTGVGFGKVKLNSGGLLFTLSVKPFSR